MKKASQPAGVLFDVDGVLVDSYRPHLESWIRTARNHGVAMTEEQFAATFGQTSREIIRRFWGDRADAEGARRIDDEKEALYRELIAASFPRMPGAVELVDELHRAGFRLAVGSSAPPANVELTLARLGCAASFDARVTGADVTRGKPDPQVFVIAAQRLGIAPARCAVIEDAPAGIAAARAAGARAIALVGTATAAQLGAADLVVASLRELSAQRITSLLG
jgi:HAD superfamily hydrolase (TIGR01509 family)